MLQKCFGTFLLQPYGTEVQKSVFYTSKAHISASWNKQWFSFFFLWFQIILTKSNSIGQKRSIKTVQFHACNARKVMEFTTLAAFMMIIVMDSFPNGFRMYNLETGVERNYQNNLTAAVRNMNFGPNYLQSPFRQNKLVPKTLSSCYFFWWNVQNWGFVYLTNDPRICPLHDFRLSKRHFNFTQAGHFSFWPKCNFTASVVLCNSASFTYH